MHGQWINTADVENGVKPGVTGNEHAENRELKKRAPALLEQANDLRRAEEAKKTQPSTQAGHWFSQALLKAVMLLDSHPGHESLVVLPDFARYRDLAERTETGRAACGVHVVFVGPEGSAASDTWTP